MKGGIVSLAIVILANIINVFRSLVLTMKNLQSKSKHKQHTVNQPADYISR